MSVKAKGSEALFLTYLEKARASKQIDNFKRPDKIDKGKPQPDFEINADDRKYFIEVYQSRWLTKGSNKVDEQQQKIANYIERKRLLYPYLVMWYQRDVLREDLIPKLARYVEEL